MADISSPWKRPKTYKTLCVSVDYETINKAKNKNNRLLEFDTECTWLEVLEDTLENEFESLKKTDTVSMKC